MLLGAKEGGALTWTQPLDGVCTSLGGHYQSRERFRHDYNLQRNQRRRSQLLCSYNSACTYFETHFTFARCPQSL
jgi:hypothetical protein